MGKHKNLLKAALSGDGEHPLVDVLIDATWRIHKNSGMNQLAADAAWEAGAKVALAGGDAADICQAAWAAGEHEMMDPAMMNAREGRYKFTATVDAFGQQKRGHRGRYITPLIYLSDITENGERIGNQWFRHGKAWDGLDLGDKVSFCARVDGYTLAHPTKVHVMQPETEAA